MDSSRYRYTILLATTAYFGIGWLRGSGSHYVYTTKIAVSSGLGLNSSPSVTSHKNGYF